MCREVVTKKFAVTIRVNNICRPDDPDAWVLPGPGTPGEDAVFQWSRGCCLWVHLPTCCETVT
jgi:hypothetical protein